MSLLLNIAKNGALQPSSESFLLLYYISLLYLPFLSINVVFVLAYNTFFVHVQINLNVLQCTMLPGTVKSLFCPFVCG